MKTRDIIVVATSTGGLEVLTQLFSDWPGDLSAAVFVVMHVGAHRSILPELLQSRCRLRVQHARHDEPFEHSVIYVAPPDRHLLLFDGKTLLSEGPAENFTRPAADPLFRSAAVNYGPRVIGVVLTGDLDDGAAGMKAVQACGGYTAVQDPANARAPSMPFHALQAVRADVVAPIAELGTAVLRATESPMVTKRSDEATVRAAAIEDRISRTGHSDPSDLEEIGERSSLTCPECGGVIWKVGHGQPLRYRCHTGHAFSAAALDYQQRKQSENAVWQAVRGLEERIGLTHEHLGQANQTGQDAAYLTERLVRLKEAKQQLISILQNGVVDDKQGQI